MLSYRQHFEGLITQLEVWGWVVYTTESEFQALKSAIEEDGSGYSLKKRDGCICETYIVK